ncbi:MAG: hypothetical protein ACI8Q9_001206, partial [Planctomycetota bacterium]
TPATALELLPCSQPKAELQHTPDLNQPTPQRIRRTVIGPHGLAPSRPSRVATQRQLHLGRPLETPKRIRLILPIHIPQGSRLAKDMVLGDRVVGPRSFRGSRSHGRELYHAAPIPHTICNGFGNSSLMRPSTGHAKKGLSIPQTGLQDAR